MHGFLMPHMVCYGSHLALIWNELISNLAIWVVYSILAGVIFYLALDRMVPYKPLWFGFVAFIGLCGATHLCHALSLFDTAMFWVQAIVEDITALVSLSVMVCALSFLPDIKKFLSKSHNKDCIEKVASIKAVQARTQAVAHSNIMRADKYLHNKSSIHGV